MSSLTLNPNEPEIENNNVLEQNSALQNNNRPRFSLNDLNVSLIPSPLYNFQNYRLIFKDSVLCSEFLWDHKILWKWKNNLFL